MSRILLLLAIIACSSIAIALPTTYTSTYNFGNTGLIWDSQIGSWTERLIISNPTVTWSHKLPDYVISSQLLSADLTIRGSGISNVLCDWDGDGPNEQTDLVKVYMNNTLLGNLTGNVTTFSLKPQTLQDNNVCSATLTFVYDRNTIDQFWFADTARLCASELIVSFDSASPAPAIVPVPGAMGLGGIGIAFVGWLRMRKQ